MYLTYRNISVGEMGPEISGNQKRTPKPKRKFILGHPVEDIYIYKKNIFFR